MLDKCTIEVDGQTMTVEFGVSVMAALSQNGPGLTRLSVQGEPRSALCGMGICQECSVTVNGLRRLACQTAVEPGMRVHTAASGA